MSDSRENDGDLSPRSASQLLDEICDSFEAEWANGRRPHIEDYLSRVDERHRAQLLTELIQSEVELRRKNGEKPFTSDYTDEFPGDKDAVSLALRNAFSPDAVDNGAIDSSQNTLSNRRRKLPAESNQPERPNIRRDAAQRKSDNTLPHDFSEREIKGNNVKRNLDSFKDYEIIEVLGQGGMGVVYKARHRHMQRIVALKTLAPAIIQDEQAVRRFQREVEAAARLNHPNIITAHDAGEEDGVHFLVMEYVDGTDLTKLVRESGPLSVDRAVNYILQAAHGLQFAHENNIVHRDVKPSNLMLDGDDQVKILDMGLARFHVSTFESADSNADLTNTGVVMGTVDYMSPEQALDAHEADQRSDIYSLGCTFYYLLAGEPVYQAETVMKKLLAHRERAVPSICEKRPDVPREVDAVIQRMLAKDTKNRYQSINEIISALQQCDLSKHVDHTMVRQRYDERQTQNRRMHDTDIRPPAAASQTVLPTEFRNKSNALRWLIVVAIPLFVLASTAFIWWISRGNDLSQNQGLQALGTTEGPKRKAGNPAANYALRFDGKSTYVEIPRLKYDGLHPITLEALVRPNQVIAPVNVISNADSCGFALVLDKGKWAFDSYMRPANRFVQTLGTTADTGVFVHLAAVFDGKELRLYIDGKLAKRTPCIGFTPSNRLPLTIGGNPEPLQLPNAVFQGEIDEVHISNAARYSKSSFKPLRPGERFHADEHTLALYHFDKGKGNIAHDSSGNGLHALINNPDWILQELDDQPNIPPLAVAPFNATHAKQHQKEWAKHLGDAVKIENSIGMKLTLIPPGTFDMGSTKEHLDLFKAYKGGGDYWLGRIYSEYPQRRTTISKPFFIGTFEVTQKQFEQVMGYNPSHFRKDRSVLPSDIADTDSFPVESITWPVATRFCAKLSALPAEKSAGRIYRLPTEAEWEYACRAGTTTLYPMGDTLSTEQANIQDEENPFSPIGQKKGLKRTTTIGSYAPNAFGLYDMIGNVWEMCSDYSHSIYDPNQTIDPKGGPETGRRISRGGAWNHLANRCRSAWRGSDSPNRPWYSLGFRVVCVLSKQSK